MRVIVNNLKLLIVGGLILSVGCTMMTGFYRHRPARFNHQVHLESAGLECGICHPGLDEGKEPSMPDLDTCTTCHGDPEQQKKYVQPFAPEGKPTWTHVTALPEDLKYRHASHLKAGLKCEGCHRGIRKSKAVSEDFRVGKDACMNCHADKKVSNRCETCHQKINAAGEPASHRRNWQRVHGLTVRDGSQASTDRCSLCHTEAYCTECHRDQKPDDHTNLWRLKTHGASASMDRQRCAACHRTDFCRYCHMENAPSTHTPAWFPPTSLHCQYCHFPLQDAGCSVCHQTAHQGGIVGAAPTLPRNSIHRTADESLCLGCHVLPSFHPLLKFSCRTCHQ